MGRKLAQPAAGSRQIQRRGQGGGGIAEGGHKDGRQVAPARAPDAATATPIHPAGHRAPWPEGNTQLHLRSRPGLRSY